VLSHQLLIVGLVGRYPANCLISRTPIFKRIAAIIIKRCHFIMLRGINPGFPGLSPTLRKVVYVFRTRLPVASERIATPLLPLDLHVLSLPLAFILSQDQTLHCKCCLILTLLIQRINVSNRMLFA
jgi:hypothetical protein